MSFLIAIGILFGTAVLDVALGTVPGLLVLMVIGTAIWAAFTAESVGESSVGTFVKVLAFWIFFFPLHLSAVRSARELRGSMGLAPEDGLSTSLNLSGEDKPPIADDPLRLTPRHDDTLQQAKTLTRPCPDCGEPILLVARKCKHCGSAVAPIGAESSGATPLPESRPTAAGAARSFCSACGSQMLESDKFCGKCGTAQEPLSR